MIALTSNDLWQLVFFFWGMLSAHLVVKGIEG